MWKVSNNKNLIPLQQLRQQIINPFWQHLITYKTLKISTSFCTYLLDAKVTEKQRKTYELMFTRENKTELLSFENLVDQVLMLDIKILKEEYSVYCKQNSQLDKIEYNIVKNKNNKLLKKLFNKFFYEVFFNDCEFWKCFTDEDCYSKQAFHNYFMQENSIFVCPYCDIDTIIDYHSKNIEHILPKNSFPYLAMHEYNLYSSCTACNSISNKGVKLPQYPFTAPYLTAIGEKSKFKIDINSRSINLYSPDDAIENYYQLINLKKRYAQESVYNAIQNKGAFLYNIISRKSDQNLDSIVDYLLYKQEPLTFAMKSIFSDWDKYISEFINKDIET